MVSENERDVYRLLGPSFSRPNTSVQKTGKISRQASTKGPPVSILTLPPNKINKECAAASKPKTLGMVNMPLLGFAQEPFSYLRYER
jgi:hypothetical protein